MAVLVGKVLTVFQREQFRGQDRGQVGARKPELFFPLRFVAMIASLFIDAIA